MTVDLEKIRLSITAITDTIVIGIPAKDNKSFIHKKDVTNDFIKTLIEWGGNYKRIVSGAGSKWEITIKKIN